MPQPRKPAAERTLLDEAERLAKSMVRDAQKRRSVKDADGKVKWVGADMIDRSRALESALKVMALKAKLDEDEPPAEGTMQHDLEAYHRERDNQGSGDTVAAEGPSDAAAGFHVTH